MESLIDQDENDEIIRAINVADTAPTRAQTKAKQSTILTKAATTTTAPAAAVTVGKGTPAPAAIAVTVGARTRRAAAAEENERVERDTHILFEKEKPLNKR